MTEPKIQMVDPADCFATDDADPAQRPDIGFLRDSLEQDGQKVPVLLAPHPEKPGKHVYVDGHGRGHCLRLLGRKMLALVLDRPVSEIERIELKFSHNALRRSMSLEEIAGEAARYIELTGCTQKEAGARLKCSDATVSRALALHRRVPADLRAAANQLGPSFVSLISPLGKDEAMRQAVEFAAKAGADGKKPSRDQVARFVAQLRGKKRPRPPRCKRIKLRIEERRYEIELKPGDGVDSLIEALRASANRLQRHRELSLEALAAVLADKEQPAA